MILCGDQKDDEDITNLMRGLSVGAEGTERPILGKRGPSLRFEWRFNKRVKKMESNTMHFMMAQHFNSLPTDVVRRIFSCFERENLTTLWRVSLVCKYWLREVWPAQQSLTISSPRSCRPSSLFSKLCDCEQIFNFPSLKLELLEEITVQAPIFHTEVSLFGQLKNLRVLRVCGPLQPPVLNEERADKQIWTVSLITGECLYFPKYHANFSRLFFPRICQFHIEGSLSGLATTRCFRLIKIASPNLENLLSDVFSLYGANFTSEIYKWLNSHDEFTIPLFCPFPKRNTSKCKLAKSDLVLTRRGEQEKLFRVVLRITDGWLYVSEEWDDLVMEL